jgi:hypothetical protein
LDYDTEEAEEGSNGLLVGRLDAIAVEFRTETNK